MAFFNFFKSLIPTVKAQEEELVDPQQELRVSLKADSSTRFSQNSSEFQEKCATESHAAHLLERYQECNNRVNSKSKTTETCTEELFDYLHVSSHKIFTVLTPYIDHFLVVGFGSLRNQDPVLPIEVNARTSEIVNAWT